MERFLTALAELHDLGNGALASQYFKYVTSHAQPFGQLHGFPSFPLDFDSVIDEPEFALMWDPLEFNYHNDSPP